MNACVSLFAQSPGMQAEAVEVVVTAPTFKRPRQILDTIASVRAQRTNRRVAMIVMENETELREGAVAAAAPFLEKALTGMVIVAHERGNCSAYNAGWETALATFPNFKYLLVIDDDEIADPDWIEQMCATAERLHADIVGGPQVPVFEDAAQQAWQAHPVFAPAHRATGRVPVLYSSGNLAISRRVLETMPRPFLDLRFNFMGGGDSDFLSRAARAGFALAWCDEGRVRETVPSRRTEADWIRARSLRNGVISTLVEKRARAGTPLANFKVLGRSLALLGAAPFRAALQLARTASPAIAIYPIYVALGRVMAEFGYSNEQYRQPERN